MLLSLLRKNRAKSNKKSMKLLTLHLWFWKKSSKKSQSWRINIWMSIRRFNLSNFNRNSSWIIKSYKNMFMMELMKIFMKCQKNKTIITSKNHKLMATKKKVMKSSIVKMWISTFKTKWCKFQIAWKI